MSANGIIPKQQYTHGLKHDITITPCLLVQFFLYEFHDSKDHQGKIYMFEVIRRSILVSQTTGGYCKIDRHAKCTVCAKHLPKMTRYPQTTFGNTTIMNGSVSNEYYMSLTNNFQG